MKYRVLVSDPLAEEGIDILKEFGDVDVNTGLTEDQLVAVIGDYDALLVRSGTEVTARVIDAGAKLKFIGRAGAGVDNIDTEAATRRGIVVANAPEGNTLAATEHTMAMMLSLARNIPQATASLKKGEWKRSKFMGVELNDKVLGVMGFGRIGREVAKRAQAMEMKCIAYDPFITKEKAATLGVEMVPLDELFRRADVITVHTPLIKETRHVINAETIATMKDGVRLINCARGGIIDEQALADGIASGKVAGAALDVFEAEPPTDSPVIGLEKVIITPHLGASTVEAQKNVAISVANQCISVLSGGAAKYVVNAPMIPAEQQAVVEPYAALAQKMGSLLIQLIEGRLESIKITYGGEAATLPNTKFITRVILKGMLDPILQAPVNFVNAEFVAKERGIRLSETTTEEAHGFRNMISITAKTDRMSESVSGSVSAPDHARIVSIGGYMTDLTPTGHVVISRHTDKPGVIGKAATILGRVNVNIAGMQVGRHKPGEEALMVLTVDSAVPAEAMEEIKKIDGIHTIKHAEI
ncbi:phosphoglycerate dehydrogenase [Methanoculleus sp. UBA430]|uniref:phosphoglycerate dehydrogenase n=1 Tax=Methanoculleus sp. UBA430 TaxID=1915511 RepID=UPI0025EB0EB0|nr:phosphoglycerate dehydrogenase [Methanoculleus sp. UBA430]